MNKVIIFLFLGMVVFYGCDTESSVDETIEEAPTEKAEPEIYVEGPKEETLDESSENYDYLDDALKSLDALE